MLTINLVGFPDDKPKQISLEVETYKEALDALKTVKEFNPRMVHERYECEIDGLEDSRQLMLPVKDGEFNLVYKKTLPVSALQGAGNANVRFVIGVILIVVSVVYFGGADGGAIGASFFAAGVSLVVGAIIEKLQGTPDEEEAISSRSARRYPNTTDSGTVLPIIIGIHRFGGHIFSANIETRKGVDQPLNQFSARLFDSRPDWDTWETLYQNANTGNQFSASFDYNLIEFVGTGGQGGGGSGAGFGWSDYILRDTARRLAGTMTENYIS